MRLDGRQQPNMPVGQVLILLLGLVQLLHDEP